MQMSKSVTRRHVPQEPRVFTALVALHAYVCQLKQEQPVQVSGLAPYYVHALCIIFVKASHNFKMKIHVLDARVMEQEVIAKLTENFRCVNWIPWEFDMRAVSVCQEWIPSDAMSGNV